MLKQGGGQLIAKFNCLTIHYFCMLFMHCEFHSVDDTSLTRSHVETGRRTVDSEIEQRDLIFLAGCFDDVEYYFDAFNLSPYEKADVRTSVTTHGTQIGMNKLLSYWKEHDPSAATFRALLDIVRRLKKKQVADSIMSYIGVTVYGKWVNAIVPSKCNPIYYASSLVYSCALFSSRMTILLECSLNLFSLSLAS